VITPTGFVDANANVQMSGGQKNWNSEPVNALITGVPYATGSSTAAGLLAAPMGDGSIRMQFERVVADGVDTTYRLRTKIGDNDWSDWFEVTGGTGSGKNREPDGLIYFQQHWGSGVRYSNIHINELD